MKYAFTFLPNKKRVVVEANAMLDGYAIASLQVKELVWSQVHVSENDGNGFMWMDVGSYDRNQIEEDFKRWMTKSISQKSHQNTIFIPFVPGSSASVSEQFSSNGGRTGGTAVSRVADDLSVIVGKYESEGYEFQKIETIHVDVSPGCIGMLMGKGKEYHPYDYLVFKKSDSQQFTSPV